MTSYKDISIQESDGDTAFDALMNNEKQINLQYENKPKMAEKFKVKSVSSKMNLTRKTENSLTSQ